MQTQAAILVGYIREHHRVFGVWPTYGDLLTRSTDKLGRVVFVISRATAKTA